MPDVAKHLYVKTPRKPRAMATALADRQERLEVPWSSSLRPRIASTGLRLVHFFGDLTPVGRYSSILGCPRQALDVVDSYHTGRKEGRPETKLVRSSP